MGTLVGMLEGSQQIGLMLVIFPWRVFDYLSDVTLTQPRNEPEGTATWGMSMSRRKAHYSLWVIRREALSDQGRREGGANSGLFCLDRKCS